MKRDWMTLGLLVAYVAAFALTAWLYHYEPPGWRFIYSGQRVAGYERRQADE